MTALPPPTYYFPGITFNSAYYPTTTTTTTSSGNGITEAQANLLYLRKTTTDTATSLETFSAGISTPLVDTSGNLTIGGNVSTTAITIGQTGVTTTVSGNELISGTLGVTGNTTLTNVAVSGNETVTGTLGVTGSLNAGAITATSLISSSLDTSTAGNLVIGGATATGINIGSSSTNPTILIDTTSTANLDASPAIGIGTSSSNKLVKLTTQQIQFIYQI